ncbi:aromatic amino acid ammonia-lyase [Vibrio vulnificus]|uniref:HAL/PAL/TAL family ammonia-lyase n=1 Tax=Vibrio vulnificus TaxID=672 RepID=UPI000934356B|nr:aromatic amino acid ammonia-lyase [Vibrio vulnificus]ELY5144271.1 aromatic amino acid lyase [Vibrio vulnificus]MCA0770050.1 aromatic amino acid ammonia-lyase [Vibrio vulnificus]MCA0778276.1 aromatic amino acid ammonia-lyase [Vibrio vulnificus]MCU8315614.1 aromatic amino acid ammonia-lyase [Vibrio vulnificus]MDS1862734.1 aromatic amino acid ammonia-lyase [Vibrio vulnificus]
MTMQAENNITFGQGRLTIEDVAAIAQGAKATLNNSVEFTAKIDRGVAFLERLLKEEGVIYGVTTGYGDSCTVAIPPQLVEELPLHLTRFHGCGLGKILTHEQARAVLATRLCSLSQGVSGVSHDLLNQIVTLINHDISPRIPEEGSVGASGDLTPLSYLAAALVGEREVIYQGEERATAEVYAELGIQPIKLRPKEGLALMNGTSVMTALACLAYKRAEYLAQLCTKITAMVSVAMHGNDFHFDEALFAVKPHPGQQQIAAWLRDDLKADKPPRNSDRLQDRYSLRCAPHVIGVVQDSLPWLRQMIENELNSANDNPIIDGDNERVLHGGHFYGGHIAMAMDTLKTGIANLADLLDRQMAQLMDYKFNNGLPFNLSGAEGERKPINHGFKAVQIGISAWTAEALKHTMPASVFSRSTECHNQDKVSMGTIAARDCLRVLELTEQVAAASLLAATQGIEIRRRRGELDENHMSDRLKAICSSVLNEFEFVTEDRPLEKDLRQFIAHIQQRHWSLY